MDGHVMLTAKQLQHSSYAGGTPCQQIQQPKSVVEALIAFMIMASVGPIADRPPRLA